MSTSDPQLLKAAIDLLRRFICSDQKSDPDLADYTLVRQALLLVANHSDYQIFGICADSVSQAAIALKTYLLALDYENIPEFPPAPQGAIYIKHNPKTGRSHIDPYAGEHRGVLVSCQSAYDGDVNETFGHLPLDLFVDGKKQKV